MKTVSFIGSGNMGSAVARAICKKIDPEEVVLYDIKNEVSEAAAKAFGCCTVSSIEEAVNASSIVLFAVKPQVYPVVVSEVFEAVKKSGENKTIASLMAGVSISDIENDLKASGLDLPVVRMMPNTPAMIGKGVFLFAGNEKANASGEVKRIVDLLEYGGLCEETTEKMIDLAMPLYSCSPAFVYMLIEALADGGVAIGVPRKDAYKYAAYGVLGSAAMVLESGDHPGKLKDDVCSPGGITIKGVEKLEEKGMRSALIEAVIACEEKRKEMQD